MLRINLLSYSMSFTSLKEIYPKKKRDGSNEFEMFNEANLFTEKEIYYIHMKCDSNEIRIVCDGNL